MFANITWRKFFKVLALIALMVAIGMCMAKAERGQVGSQHVADTWMYIMASLFGIYDAILFVYLTGKAIRGRRTKKTEEVANGEEH